jgi:uncharacterized protein YkwD
MLGRGAMLVREARADPSSLGIEAFDGGGAGFEVVSGRGSMRLASVFGLFFLVCVLAGCSGASATPADWEDMGAITADDATRLEEVRNYNLQRINDYRQREGLPPLELDSNLNEFSQAASEQLSRDRTPHQYFAKNARECSCRVAAENQGRREGSMLIDLYTQIDQLLDAMMAEPPGGGHRENILSKRHRRMGAGFVSVGKELYLTNDFGH